MDNDPRPVRGFHLRATTDRAPHVDLGHCVYCAYWSCRHFLSDASLPSRYSLVQIRIHDDAFFMDYVGRAFALYRSLSNEVQSDN